jgi:hypothetical protein
MKRQEQLTQMLTQMRGHGMMLTTITQSADMFKGPVRRRRPAFDDWVRQLTHGNRLSRGRYFRGKRPSGPLYAVDQFWQHYS